jgi:cation:H+ antiporter
VEIALQLGLSQLVVGLTIISAGTSLPEVATSIVAAVKGERDIAVGNAVGSNIFNILSVLGVTAVVSSTPIVVPSAAINFDIPVMVAVAVACLPVFFSGIIARWQGGLFLAYYIAYIGYVLLNAAGHDALEGYSLVMVLFAFPLTAIALGVSVYREFRRRQRGTSRATG